MIKYLISIFLLMTGFVLFADESSLLNEYVLLIEDINNIDTPAYKSAFVKAGSGKIMDFDFSESKNTVSQNPLDFSIHGPGFLKVYDDSKKAEYFSRYCSLTINSEGFLANADGFKILPELKIDKKVFDKLQFSDNGLNYRYGKTSIEYKFKLYMPVAGSAVAREKNYFIFEKYDEASGFSIVGRSLEQSNVKLTSSLLRMLFILNALDKAGSKKIKEIKTKELLVEKLLDASNQWQTNINEENVILEIKSMITKAPPGDLKSLAMLKSIIADYSIFLAPDYE